jgi:hypothetical protein
MVKIVYTYMYIYICIIKFINIYISRVLNDFRINIISFIFITKNKYNTQATFIIAITSVYILYTIAITTTTIVQSQVTKKVLLFGIL